MPTEVLPYLKELGPWGLCVILVGTAVITLIRGDWLPKPYFEQLIRQHTAQRDEAIQDRDDRIKDVYKRLEDMTADRDWWRNHNSETKVVAKEAILP